jgi:hypothetical protein
MKRNEYIQRWIEPGNEGRGLILIGRYGPTICDHQKNELEEKAMRRSISILTVTLFTISVMALFIVGFYGTANAIAQNSEFVNTKLSKEDCKAEARHLLHKGEFIDIDSSGTYTVIGTKGPYVAFIRSMPETQKAIIVITGPDHEVCNRLLRFFVSNGAW